MGGVATAAAVRTWPFRVYSFPTELRIFSLDELRRIYVGRAMAEIDRTMTEMADSHLNALPTILLAPYSRSTRSLGDRLQQPATLTRASSSVYVCIAGSGPRVLFDLQTDANSPQPSQPGPMASLCEVEC